MKVELQDPAVIAEAQRLADARHVGLDQLVEELLREQFRQPSRMRPFPTFDLEYQEGVDLEDKQQIQDLLDRHG